MTYTTKQDLIDRFGEPMLIDLTDRGEVATGVIDDAVIDEVLADTDALIDGYLAHRYALPLSSPQPLVTYLARDIAIYKLHTYAPDDKIEADYKDALRSLEKIGQGNIRLTAAGVAPQETGGGGARVTDRERPMTGQNLKSFI